MRTIVWFALTVLMFAADVAAADFGTRGGPEPANIDEIANVLRQDPYDMELLISYGTSKGGSAGHLALAIRDQASGDDLVYTANFYADRAPEHAKGFYTDDLMVRIPKKEYLFKTTSSLGDTASFGLDFGEIYKRSVIGVRVYGVPAAEKEALAAFFKRINDDYHNRVSEHRVPRRRDTVRLHAPQLRQDHRRRIQVRRRVPGPRGHEREAFLRAEGGGSCQRQHSHRDGDEAPQGVERARLRVGRGLYKKYEGSTYVDPHEEEKVAFKDLPNRFPSVLSRDFRKEQGQYEDFDNLFAMYLLYNLGKYSVRVNDETKLLEIDEEQEARWPTRRPPKLATQSAKSDSEGFRRRLPFRRKGTEIGDPTDESNKKTVP